MHNIFPIFYALDLSLILMVVLVIFSDLLLITDVSLYLVIPVTDVRTCCLTSSCGLSIVYWIFGSLFMFPAGGKNPALDFLSHTFMNDMD